jgi:hypothetical protein
MGVGIPSTWKMSKAVLPFEAFGDVVRSSVDNKRRLQNKEINIFITYADSVAAKRALEEKIVRYDGATITMEVPNWVRQQERDRVAANKRKWAKTNTETHTKRQDGGERETKERDRHNDNKRNKFIISRQDNKVSSIQRRPE